MKKYSLLLFLVVVLFGCNTNQTPENMIDISANEISEKVSNRESFLLLITTSSCSPCEDFISDMEATVDENGLEVYILDNLSVEETMRDQLQLIIGGYTSLPVLMYVENGEVYDTNKYEYSLNPEGWESWLIERNIIQAK